MGIFSSKSSKDKGTGNNDTTSKVKEVRKNSFRKYFADKIKPKLLGGLNIGWPIYYLSGAMASDTSYGMYSVLAQISKSFKDVSSITLSLIDEKHNTLTTYISLHKEIFKGKHILKASFSRDKIDISNDSNRYIGLFLDKNGLNVGTYETESKNKKISYVFSMRAGDFNIVTKTNKKSENTNGSESSFNKSERIIVPISSPNSENLIGFLEIKGGNLKLNGKWFRMSAMAFSATAARLLYNFISGKIDHLTKLLKREVVTTSMMALTRKFLTAKKEEKKGSFNFSVLMLDIDHFKKFNDEYGHPIGDEVLRKVARTINSNIRYREKHSDIAGRYGGEEFLIVAAGSEEIGSIIGNRVRKELAKKPFDIDKGMKGGRQASIHMSAGISDVENAYQMLEMYEKSYDFKGRDLVEQFYNENPEMKSEFLDYKLVMFSIYLADKALYESKEKGRNQVSTMRFSKDSGVYYNVLKD